ncbi:MAG: hypothetical protein ACRD2K_06345 [Terriglobales bacterium]
MKKLAVCLVALLAGVVPAARGCTTAADMDPATRAAAERTAQNYFQMAARGDSAGLRQSAVAALAADFLPVEAAVRGHQAIFAAAQPPQLRAEYLLEAEGATPLERAEFFCGVWPTPGFTVFVLNNLAPGRYAVVVLEAKSGKGAYRLSLVLAEQQRAWKLAGFYPRPAEIAGHDGKWFWEQAHAYKDKRQPRNAWFYYLAARELLSLVPFMSNQQLEQLASELPLPPQGLPGEKPVDFLAANKVFRIAQVYVVPDDDGLQLVLQHQVADASKPGPTHADNLALIQGWVTTYPEYREAFTAVVARASDSAGHDYGSRLEMKDVK